MHAVLTGLGRNIGHVVILIYGCLEVKKKQIRFFLKRWSTLAGLTGGAKLEILEAVPIDGVHDRDVYYAPAVAAGGVSASPNPDVYYMQSFENSYDVDGKRYSVIVKERDYHFVHEIQHWLHDEQNYGLKINRK